MTTTQHVVWTQVELMVFFTVVWGLCIGPGGLRGERTHQQKSTNLEIHGRKSGNHTSKSQHMIQDRKRRKFGSTVHTFRGFITILRVTTVTQEGQREFTVTATVHGVVTV